MPYKDPLTADTVLVRGAIQSPNYVAGVSGWIVRLNGTAEFSDLIARGLIVANEIKTSDLQTVARLWVNNPAGDPNVILFYKEDQNDATPLKQLAKIYGSAFAAQNPGLHLEAWGDVGDPDFTGLQIVAGVPVTGVGAIIELTSPDTIDLFSKPGWVRANALRVLDQSDLHVQDLPASANLTLTAAWQDIPAMSYTFTPDRDCDVAISATFDELVSIGIGAGGLALHRCVVDGVVQPRTPYVTADTPHREMTPGTWGINGLAGGVAHTIKFQAEKSINAGTVALQSSVSSATLTVLANGGPP